MQNSPELNKQLKQIQERYNRFYQQNFSLNVPELKQHVDSILCDLLALRVSAKTRADKHSVTRTLRVILSALSEDSKVSFGIRMRFTSRVKEAQQNPDKYFIPAVVLPEYSTGHVRSSLFDLPKDESLNLCHCIFAIMTDEQTAMIASRICYCNNLLRTGLQADPTGVDAQKRNQAFVTYLYDCFDNLEVPENVIHAIEDELLSSAILKPYVYQEYKKRSLRAVSLDDLRCAVNAYESRSWMGWFWNVALCGIFGRHQSYTVAALQELCNQQVYKYQESDIKACIEKAEPYYAKHRLAFFTNTSEPTTSGTDKVLQAIEGSMSYRIEAPLYL